MKIKKEHYKELKEIIEYGLSIKPRLRKKYRKHGWSDKAYAWTLYDTCVPDKLFRTLREYLNDNNIETALLKIIREK